MPLHDSTASPPMSTSRWQQLAVWTAVLVAVTTVLLVATMFGRDVAPTDRSPPSGMVPVSTSDGPASLESTSAGERDKATALPSRTRVYSPVDVKTLADARAHGAQPEATHSAIDEDADRSAVATQANVAPRIAPVSGDAVAPLSTPRPRVPHAGTVRPAAKPPVSRQAQAPMRAPAPPEHFSQTRAQTRTVTTAPAAAERAAPRDLPVDPPRTSRQDAASAELDAVWARREQWMRERLRQR